MITESYPSLVRLFSFLLSIMDDNNLCYDKKFMANYG